MYIILIIMYTYVMNRYFNHVYLFLYDSTKCLRTKTSLVFSTRCLFNYSIVLNGYDQEI